MTIQLLEFALTALIIELTPGPNMAWLAALSLAEGRRAGLAAVAGVSLGLAGIGVAAVFGLAAVLDGNRILYDVLRYAGSVFLLYLAWEGWRGAEGNNGEKSGRAAAFGRALAQNLLNPKAALFYIAVMPMFLVPGRQDVMAQSLVLVVIYVSVATAVHAGIVLFAASLRPYLVAGPHERLVRRLLAVSLALVAIWFFWSTHR
ncbi:MAG: lysine exporter protein [Beijerinckiaceae bacterium]|nr:MAG: lysine exporter protein [Beijerinckiaceae bacterium]